jgi:hypothetical protein
MRTDEASLRGRSGRGVRIAVVDSGVHASHPHVQGVAGGTAIGPDGTRTGDFVDRIGHGTAVTAAIKEKAPDAEIFSVRIFDRALTTSLPVLVAALKWAADNRMRVVNLSLGTSKPEHRPALAAAVAAARSRGVVVVAARDDGGVEWLPGMLAGVVPVQVDWDCPRDRYYAAETDTGMTFRASGFPREIPGVPPQRNLHGISFAVANITGFVARWLEDEPYAFVDEVIEGLSARTVPAPATAGARRDAHCF